ncbi:hypothetical protein M0813_06877 [Anaeramoeba flamelloides]|uniref:Uncharacterized protein n=1 Tax=Anaeramoeba flamelloides TaxID=1746091 RepID=A0ABQ8XDS3_9EUKA|nr:hypothetical protein M0813_06877 [Anaeramoeba flamelloides]
MSSSLPINCINSDLLKIIFQKFNHQSSENKFSKQRAEVVQLRLRKDWNRVYSELVEEGHWNPQKRKRTKENGLYTDKQDIILSKCTLATNNRSIKPCNRNQDTGTLPQTLKTYIHPQKKDKNLKEKEINQKDNNDSLDRIFDNSRSVEYNNEEQIHYDYNPLFNQNNKFLFENKNGEDLLFCLKENREIIKKYKKHIDGLMESQNILNQKISDLSVLFTNKFESFLKTQNQILDCLAKNQTAHANKNI